ncbi:unnamed protein product [Oikopleura dioica]|uniref:Uncharacterized protein n=1 Tax=Oikopleura dioica TaxID=34765 RepID=E4WWL0_OIKDI|nr:unnamed protein product [Oikopleura dioica]
MAESYMHSNGIKIENCEHEEKTLWKKRMVQSHATADEMNTKFLSHLDLRFESLNKLPGQFNFFQSAIEELKPFIAQQIQKMSENLVNEQRKIEARVSKQVRDVERDYTHKMEQISSQIYDMHKELQSVRGKIREDFLHADSNTHDKIVGVEEQCTTVAERLTDINCDTLSLNEKFTEMKDKIIDDRLAFIKQSEEMLRLKEGQEKILRLLRGPESLQSNEKKERPTNVSKRRSAESEDSRSCRDQELAASQRPLQTAT